MVAGAAESRPRRARPPRPRPPVRRRRLACRVRVFSQRTARRRGGGGCRGGCPLSLSGMWV